MANDKLFQKRKAKRSNDLARKKAKRHSYKRILIICEGSKTEPNYLNEIIDDFELNTANVEVDGRCGTAPTTIVNYAKDRYKEEKQAGDPYDLVFCVFDKDSHPSYNSAIREINSSRPQKTFFPINSVPCFEYWLLLHFEYTVQPFIKTGTKSSCDNSISKLKKYMPDYEKGDPRVYNQIMKHTDEAIKRSKSIMHQVERTKTDNPSTMMHLLVETLQNLKKPK